MLQFLQTGKVLYVLAAVCALGIISKLVTGNLYKRLIKETGNMALTKNRNLRALKQKTENMFLLSHGLRNPAAYIEKQVYGFRFMKISLDDWDNFSVQTMILCFLIGGVAAFGSYWYRCDSYYIVLYGTMGILSGLFMVLVDNGVNIGVKRQQLMDCLVDYVENSPHFYKNVDKAAEGERADRKNRIVPAAGPGFRDLGRRGLRLWRKPQPAMRPARRKKRKSCVTGPAIPVQKNQRERLGEKMEPPRERGLEPGFLFYPGKRGRTGRKKDPGRAAPGRNGTRTGMGTSWRAALNI